MTANLHALFCALVQLKVPLTGSHVLFNVIQIRLIFRGWMMGYLVLFSFILDTFEQLRMNRDCHMKVCSTHLLKQLACFFARCFFVVFVIKIVIFFLDLKMFRDGQHMRMYLAPAWCKFLPQPMVLDTEHKPSNGLQPKRNSLLKVFLDHKCEVINFSYEIDFGFHVYRASSYVVSFNDEAFDVRPMILCT